MSDIWDDPKRIETLKRMWAAGNSAALIAQALGSDVTRSAVIGKIHRLGISERGVVTIAQIAPSGAPPRKTREERMDDLIVHVAQGRMPSSPPSALFGEPRAALPPPEPTPAPPKRPPPARRAAPPASPPPPPKSRPTLSPDGEFRMPPLPRPDAAELRALEKLVGWTGSYTGPLAVLALGENTCHWPFGDPGHPEFRFCLAVTEVGDSYCPHHRVRASDGRPPRIKPAYDASVVKTGI